MSLKYYVLLTFIFPVYFSNAQQVPHYTQYVLNQYILNPAVSGIENYVDIKIAARDQWVGLDGAPRTAYLSIHGPIGKKDYKTSATSFSIPGNNPRGEAYWENYTASEPHHGIGFLVINDKTGNFNRFTASASYAYHIGINANTNISGGVSAGISQISRDITKSDFGGGENYDPAHTTNAGIRRTIPDLNAGLWMYNKNYFIGVAAQQIIPQEISFVSNAIYGGKLIPHIFSTAGYRVLLNEDFNMIPSLMMKYVTSTPGNPQFDLNVKLQYQDLLWGGGSFRINEGYSAMIGLNLGNTFNFGYAYDISHTALRSASQGTHEIIFGFIVNNRYGDTCPRNLW